MDEMTGWMIMMEVLVEEIMMMGWGCHGDCCRNGDGNEDDDRGAGSSGIGCFRGGNDHGGDGSLNQQWPLSGSQHSA